MPLVHRVLYPRAIVSLEDHVGRGGGKGLAAARDMTPDQIIEAVLASGLRGRGGAGFPTGRKWRTVADNAAGVGPPTVVVNAAEGEPGTLKDRTILRRNPFGVVEGALVAARATGADLIVFATKEAFSGEVDRLREAVEQAEDAGWSEGVAMTVFEGPDEYLYGEESALLETISGRWPFPRVVPTFRRGVTGGEGPTPPALVNNTETLANVARIVARGSAWFRTMGTEESPGTAVCTVTGDTHHHGVGEVQMGTPLGEVIELIGGGPREGRKIKAVMSGVANAIMGPEALDAPVSYEGLRGAGSGIGSAGFIVFDETADMVAVAAGVSRFLAVESCGQCAPCKIDGASLAQTLLKIAASQAIDHDRQLLDRKLSTVADRARCFLATQQQVMITSILSRFPEEFEGRMDRSREPVSSALISELIDIRNGKAVLDERHRRKQPDWTYNKRDSGTVPVERYASLTPPWGLGALA
ncbi:MAG: NADH-ubiquinone oxidoreductase-F iron-sulfur binding region domain-containing protein [Acidimicrobiales bacterium]